LTKRDEDIKRNHSLASNEEIQNEISMKLGKSEQKKDSILEESFVKQLTQD